MKSGHHVTCGTKNKIFPGHLYFLTLTVVDWVDMFTCPVYKHIIVNSLKYYKFWKDGNEAKELISNAFTEQKLNYTHQNPVVGEIVEEPEHYFLIRSLYIKKLNKSNRSFRCS